MNDELHRLLAAAAALESATGIKVVVIGGIARGNWAQPRNTDDVDVVVDTNALAPFIAAAAAIVRGARSLAWPLRGQERGAHLLIVAPVQGARWCEAVLSKPLEAHPAAPQGLRVHVLDAGGRARVGRSAHLLAPAART